ncbi:MAG: endonuclease/exonuclease/phosphatase family protein, partial [Planctomycetota bacterium]
PLDNLYGIAVFSRLPMRAGVEFLVQDDIPSVHGTVELADGSPLQFHAVHPRPPMPGEYHSSAPRDAELVLLGQRIRNARNENGAVPTLVVGDLNDVAWSKTTRLFLRLSGLLDPRRGRGMFNTFHANYPPIRFPLDHGFISEDLRLVEIRRLPHCGSDHFPVLFVLEYDPIAAAQQAGAAAEPGDIAMAHEKLRVEAQH